MRNTDYPHDGVIGWDDPFWQSLEREQTNEDQARMTMTAAEYEEYLAECERQDGIDHNAVESVDDSVKVIEDGVLYTYINGEWVAEGAEPIGAGESYYDLFSDPVWQNAIELAAQGNFLDS